MRNIREERMLFNKKFPVEEHWFERDDATDVCFLHIEGLDQQNLENDGMSLCKAAELVEILLDAIHLHVEDLDLEYPMHEMLHDELMSIRQHFRAIAPLVKKF